MDQLNEDLIYELIQHCNFSSLKNLLSINSTFSSFISKFRFKNRYKLIFANELVISMLLNFNSKTCVQLDFNYKSTHPNYIPTGYLLAFYSDRIIEYLPMPNYVLDTSQSLLCKLFYAPPFYYHYVMKMNPSYQDIITIIFHLTDLPIFNQKRIKDIPLPPSV